jgi:large repetitive protein
LYGQNVARVTLPRPTIVSSMSVDDATIACTFTPGSVTLTIGRHSILCTASSPSHGNSSCQYNVVVVDDQYPLIACPADVNLMTQKHSSFAQFSWSLLAQDNDVLRSSDCSSQSGSSFAVGRTFVFCQATDLSNLTSTCNFSVTVADFEPPVIQCPESVRLATSRGASNAMYSWAMPSVSLGMVLDNVNLSRVNCSRDPANSTFSLGVVQILCIATDGSGNIASCNFAVSVIDSEPPQLDCLPYKLLTTLSQIFPLVTTSIRRLL